MSKVQVLRALVKQRLTLAAEEIFGLFERTIAEFEEELCRSREENERHRKLLDAVFNPEVRLHSADVQQLLASKEELPAQQQEWSPLLDQEDPEPPHIKEEQEEPWRSQDGEQLHQLEEADVSKFMFTPVPVKREEEEEKPQTSQLHQTQTEQMRTGAAGEDCGGPEPARNSDPEGRVETDESEDSSETDDSDENWTQSRKPRPHLKKQKQMKVTGSLRTSVAGERQFLLHSCSECGKRFSNKTNLKVHMKIHTQEKPFSCLVCGQKFPRGESLRKHMAVHSGRTRLRCTDCGSRFIWYKKFQLHKCLSLQSSQLHHKQTEQMEAEAAGCGGAEPARNSDPEGRLHPEDTSEDSSFSSSNKLAA